MNDKSFLNLALDSIILNQLVIQKQLSSDDHKKAMFIYLLLAGIFISMLVTCNLIFLKFISWKPFDVFEFNISVGLIPYPLTFLVTDLISELFGRKKANDVVKVGLVCAFLIMGVTMVANSIPAIEGSPVGDDLFNQVFGLTFIAVLSSMIAYLLAQFIDIRIFHFWKQKTNGKHLWIRNNFSTITSQLVDTFAVLSILTFFGGLESTMFWTYFLSSFLFKVIVAAADTPVFYVLTFYLKRKFKLEDNEEIAL